MTIWFCSIFCIVAILLNIFISILCFLLSTNCYLEQTLKMRFVVSDVLFYFCFTSSICLRIFYIQQRRKKMLTFFYVYIMLQINRNKRSFGFKILFSRYYVTVWFLTRPYEFVFDNIEASIQFNCL